MNKKLSVIIPLYNNAGSIEKCLKSVITQTYNELEIIVVNDGSTDDSCEVVSKYASIDKRIIMLQQKNSGVSTARNKGIETATGDYITFLDSDDWIEHDTYMKMMNGFSESEIDIVIGGFVREQAGMVIPVLDRGMESVMRSEDAILELLRNRIFRGELCDKIYRHNLFDNLRLDDDIAVAEDWLMNWKVFHKAKLIHYIPVLGYHYVINNNSVCHVFTRKNLSHIKGIERMLDIPDKSHYINHIIMGIYGRTLASNILKMLLIDENEYKKDIMDCQVKLRNCLVDAAFAPYLSIRQRVGIIYAAMPMKICSMLAGYAKRWQRNM